MTFGQGIGLATGAGAALVVGFALARRVKLPALPPWSWRNIIALLALAASLGGAVALTALIWTVVTILRDDADRLVGELVRDPKARPEVGQVLVKIYDSIADNLIVFSFGLLIILIGFGFAITARRFEGELFGQKFNWSGGEPEASPAAAAARTADAAAQEAQEIRQETAAPRPEWPLQPPPAADDGVAKPE